MTRVPHSARIQLFLRAGGQGGRDYYAEMNAWSYTWHVQHDLAGLINLMGGRDSFVAKLDRLFTEQYRGSPPSGARAERSIIFRHGFRT
jgi:putative alpha-1,2-mannosidase